MNTDFAGKKKMMNPNEHFVPQKSVAWLIGVQKYDRVREAERDPEPDCSDLDQVPEHIARMEHFFNSLKFDQVIKTEDPDRDLIDRTFLDIQSLLRESDKDAAESILLYVYFSGHGVIDSTTKIVLN